jgi:hypothetical protein
VRQGHELRIQRMTQDVRFLQWRSTEESTASLLISRSAVLERLRYYQRLLGLPEDANAKDFGVGDLTRAELPRTSQRLSSVPQGPASSAQQGSYVNLPKR